MSLLEDVLASVGNNKFNDLPIADKKSYNDKELSLEEPLIKINLRGKKKDFFAKVGKILSIILPTESNTSSSNEKFTAMWLSPDEWMIYSKDNNQNIIFDELYNEISKLNHGSITNVSDQWICINLKGKNIYEMLSTACPFDFTKFKANKNSTTQTLVNHIDVIIHHKEENNLNLFVRRSFSEHLWLWLNDSAKFI